MEEQYSCERNKVLKAYCSVQTLRRKLYKVRTKGPNVSETLGSKFPQEIIVNLPLFCLKTKGVRSVVELG